MMNRSSYWKVKLGVKSLSSRREFGELDVSFDLLRGTRPVDWTLDIVGSGDNAHIEEITLCTPVKSHTLLIYKPYTAIQFKHGYVDLFTGRQQMAAQIIARVDNQENGDCVAAIWDVAEQRLYTDFHSNVHHFGAWKEGMIPIGALSAEVVGFRLTGGVASA